MSSHDPIRRVCGVCNQIVPAKGTRMLKVFGRRVWVCLKCAETLK